jgi:hypothetical protein
MTAFVQLTFQLSPLAVTVTVNPGSSAATVAVIAAMRPANSSAVFILSSKVQSRSRPSGAIDNKTLEVYQKSK